MIDNRKARHDYEIIETVEAGIVLTGPEVKSLRLGRAGISDAFAVERGGELWISNMRIDPLPNARDQGDPKRLRKLLLHRREIATLAAAVARKGLTVVPLNVHERRGRFKLELGLAKGRNAHDKRQAAKERDWKREKARLLA